MRKKVKNGDLRPLMPAHSEIGQCFLVINNVFAVLEEDFDKTQVILSKMRVNP